MKKLCILIAIIVWILATIVLVCTIIGLFMFVIDDGLWMEFGHDLKNGLLD
jgi:hypothetical protein